MRYFTSALQAITLISVVGVFGSRLSAQPPPELVTVTGSVTVEGTDQPAAGITVELISPGDAEGGTGWQGRTTTDEQGQFSLEEVPEGPYRLSLRGEGYRTTSQELQVTLGMEPLALTVQRWPQIRGQIRRPDGTLLANVQIQGRWTFRQETGGMSGQAGISVSTDEQGRYAVPVRDPGRYRLTLIAPEVGYGRSDELEVRTEDLEGIDIQLRPGASVTGQVRVQGTDEPPQQVRLRWEERRDGMQTSSSFSLDQQGGFALQDLPPGDYRISAYGPGYLRTPPQSLKLTEGQEVTGLVIEMIPAPTVSGRLRAPDGVPLAHQEVEFRAHTRKGRSYRGWDGVGNRLTLDENGGFTVQATEEGPALIYFRLEDVGYWIQNLEIQAGEDLTDLEYQLIPFAEVTGQVREKRTQEPLPGIRVRLWMEQTPGFPGPSPQATSDANGRFELQSLTVGEYRVSVDAEGYRYSNRQRIRVVADTPPEELLIELEKGTPVAGRVWGPDGKTPQAGVRIAIQNLEQTTDAEGRFAFESVVWGNELRVEAEGFAPITQPLRLEGADHPIEVTLTLQFRGGTVTGQVRHEATQQPVANGIVFVGGSVVSRWGNPAYLLRQLTSTQRPQGQGFNLDQWPWQQLKGAPLAQTDGEGRYELTHVLEGEYTLYAVVPGQGFAQRENVAVREGQETAGIDFDIPSPQEQTRVKRITGRLTGPDGQPLENVNVSFKASTSRASFGSSIQSEADGHYVVDLAGWDQAGTEPFALAVKVEGFRTAQREQIDLGEEGTAENVDFQLEPLPLGSLAGQVFLPDGATPAVGVWVVPVRPGREWPDPMANSSVASFDGKEYVAGASQATVTDAEGHYRIDSLEAGPYHIYALPRVSRYGGLPDPPIPSPPPDPRLEEAAPTLSDAVAVPEQGVGEVNVTLGRGGTLEGVVWAAENEDPLADVSVRVQSSDRRFSFDRGWGGSEGERTDAQGRFRMMGLPPGTYHLSASIEGRRSPRSQVTLTAGATTQVELKMGVWKPLSIAGQVLLPDGQTPAPLAYVALRSRFALPRRPVRTDAQGRFELTLTSTTREPLRVVARKVGYGQSASDWLNFGPGQQPPDLVLILAEAGTISGQIAWAEESEPWEEVIIMALPAAEPLVGIYPDQSWNRGTNIFYRQSRPDEDGRFTLTDVTAGSNTVVVFVKNIPRLVQREVGVQPGGGSEELNLRVPPARGQISGTVTAAEEGTPLAGGGVTVFNEEWIGGDFRLRAQTDDQGRYTLEGLPPGTYRVFVSAPNRASQASAEVAVGEEPVTGVDFHLSPGGSVTGTLRGPDGEPVLEATVATVSPSSGWPGRMPPPGLSWGYAPVNQDGTYTLEHLAPGEYTLYFSAPGYPEGKREGVVVREGEMTEGVNWTLSMEQ